MASASRGIAKTGASFVVARPYTRDQTNPVPIPHTHGNSNHTTPRPIARARARPVPEGFSLAQTFGSSIRRTRACSATLRTSPNLVPLLQAGFGRLPLQMHFSRLEQQEPQKPGRVSETQMPLLQLPTPLDLCKSRTHKSGRFQQVGLSDLPTFHLTIHLTIQLPRPRVTCVGLSMLRWCLPMSAPS